MHHEYRLKNYEPDVLIEKLKKKHGGSVTTVLAAKQVLQGELEVLLGQSSRIKQAKKESLLVQQECLQKAVVLSHLRQASAKEMEGLVETGGCQTQDQPRANVVLGAHGSLR